LAVYRLGRDAADSATTLGGARRRCSGKALEVEHVFAAGRCRWHHPDGERVAEDDDSASRETPRRRAVSPYWRYAREESAVVTARER